MRLITKFTLTDDWDLKEKVHGLEREYHWYGSPTTTYNFGSAPTSTGEAHYTGWENDAYGDHNWGTDYDFGDGSMTYHHDNPDPDANSDDHWSYECNGRWSLHEHVDAYGNMEECPPPTPDKFASGMTDSSPPFRSSLGDGGVGLSYNSDWANVTPSKPAPPANKPNFNPPPGGWAKPNVQMGNVFGAGAGGFGLGGCRD